MKLLPCSHRPPCPGCPRYGAGGVAPEAMALLSGLASTTGAVLDDAVEGTPLGFRVRARLAVRGRASNPKIGIFQEGSHAIVDIPSCTIHHPRLNAAARVLREALRETGLAPYADLPHAGLLRYVQLLLERSTSRLQVTLVTNDASPDSVMPLAALFASRLGEKLQGLWWNGNTERTNVIFGPDWKLLAGSEAVRETIGGASVFFPPGAFGQSNLDLADRLVEDLHARVPDDAVVAELYCGVGAIGMGLLPRSREVRFNEAAGEGLRGLEMGLAAMPLRVRAKARVVGGDAARADSLLEGADTVIVDPPRKGLASSLLAATAAAQPRRLLYVSCDPSSLVRDATALVSTGALRLARLTPYALFPYTTHVETLAEFTA